MPAVQLCDVILEVAVWCAQFGIAAAKLGMIELKGMFGGVVN